MLSGISITLSWHKGKSWWKYIYTSTYIYIYTYENRYRYKYIWSPQSAQGQLQKQRWKAYLLQTAHPLPQTKCTSALDTVIVVASVSFGQCTTWRSEEVAQIVRFFDSLDILSFARGCEADDHWHLAFDQWTNGPMDQSTSGPMDEWTNEPRDQWTNGQKTLATLCKEKHIKHRIIGILEH